MIIKAMELGPFMANGYIVGSEKTKEGMLIDPGDEGKRILRAVKELGLTIKLIVLTHCHIDHIGALAEVKQGTAAQIAIHADDADGLRAGEQRIFKSMAGLPYEDPPLPDRFLKDGEAIDVGDLHFTVLHTPGHSPGGICLVGEGVVFTGDTLFYYSIGRYDMTGGDGARLMNSIHTKLMTLPDKTTVYPGHGPATSIGNERRGNPFLNGEYPI